MEGRTSNGKDGEEKTLLRATNDRKFRRTIITYTLKEHSKKKKKKYYDN